MQPGASGYRQSDCTQDIKVWWNGLPFMNKVLIGGCTIIYLMDIFFFRQILTKYLMNCPYLSILNLQVWRLLTSWMVHMGILSLLFSLLSIYYDAIRLEKLLGSTNFFLDLLFKNFIIETFFSLFMAFLSFVMDSDYFVYQFSSGLWTIVMEYITLRSLAFPENEVNFLCFPILIKQKYYPWALFIFFNLFNFPQIQFDLLCAILVGYFEARYFNGMILRISKNRLQIIELSCLFQSISQRDDYITVSACPGVFFGPEPQFSGQAARNGGGDQQQNNQPQSYTVNPSQSGSGSQPFSGKGVQLGGSGNVNRYKQNQRDEESQGGVQSAVDDQNILDLNDNLVSKQDNQQNKPKDADKNNYQVLNEN